MSGCGNAGGGTLRNERKAGNHWKQAEKCGNSLHRDGKYGMTKCECVSSGSIWSLVSVSANSYV
jgi:hypothetical protein